MGQHKPVAADPLLCALQAVAECGAVESNVAPRRPTPEMIAAGVVAGSIDESTVRRIYDAMLTTLD